MERTENSANTGFYFSKDESMHISARRRSRCHQKGQNPPEGYHNLEKMLKELANHGVEILACRTCLHARGMTETDLAQRAKVGTMVHLAQWTEQSQKVLSF